MSHLLWWTSENQRSMTQDLYPEREKQEKISSHMVLGQCLTESLCAVVYMSVPSKNHFEI
jgi:hypothetical protein